MLEAPEDASETAHTPLDSGDSPAPGRTNVGYASRKPLRPSYAGGTNDAQHRQQNHGPDEGDEDGAREAGHRRVPPHALEEPAADKGTDNPDDNVAAEPVSPLGEGVCQKARHPTHDNPQQEGLNRHVGYLATEEIGTRFGAGNRVTAHGRAVAGGRLDFKKENQTCPGGLTAPSR